MLLPGGMPVVHTDDVATAHVKAVDEAPVGSRFIVADRYLTLSEIAESVAAIVPGARKPPVMPIRVARLVSSIGERIAARTGKPPLIPRGGADLPRVTSGSRRHRASAPSSGSKSLPGIAASPRPSTTSSAQGWRTAA